MNGRILKSDSSPRSRKSQYSRFLVGPVGVLPNAKHDGDSWLAVE
jgi:hypothetical protein